MTGGSFAIMLATYRAVTMLGLREMLHIILLIFATVYEKGMSFSLFDRWQIQEQ